MKKEHEKKKTNGKPKVSTHLEKTHQLKQATELDLFQPNSEKWIFGCLLCFFPRWSVYRARKKKSYLSSSALIWKASSSQSNNLCVNSLTSCCWKNTKWLVYVHICNRTQWNVTRSGSSTPLQKSSKITLYLRLCHDFLFLMGGSSSTLRLCCPSAVNNNALWSLLRDFSFHTILVQRHLMNPIVQTP